MRIDLGNGFLIRDFRPDDVKVLARHANNEKIAHNLEDRFPHPYTAQDAIAWLDHLAQQDPVTHFAIANRSGAVGSIGFRLLEDVYRGTAELGYWLGEAFWGQGVTTLAVRAITLWIFDNHPLERIQAKVFETNPASCRVLEKAGYIYEGRMRLGALKVNLLMDLVVYAILRHESEAKHKP